MINWLILCLAGFVEIGMIICLKYSKGWTVLLPSILGCCLATLSVILLTYALKSLHVQTAYAVWTAIGTVGATLAGSILFNDSFTIYQFFFICLIVIGMVGLRIVSN